MKTTAVVLGAAAAMFLAGCDRGQEEQTQARAEEGLVIQNGWCQAAPQGATATSCFVTLTNNTGEDERLTGVTSSAAARAELHETYADGNVLRMRPVEALTIPARATVELKPGSYGIRLVDLTSPMVVGGNVPVELQFARAGSQQMLLPVRVEPPGAAG